MKRELNQHHLLLLDETAFTLLTSRSTALSHSINI